VIRPDDVEGLRPLLPVGYGSVVDAYRAAVDGLQTDDLTRHYTDGQDWFHREFSPALIERLHALSGGEWDLSGWQVVAAGSDVDLMTHLIEATAARGPVRLYPGDWYGFLVGGTHDDAITFDAERPGDLACVCIPSVRNGHLTNEMSAFLGRSPVQLLNLNLYPTLAVAERQAIARALGPLLPTSLLSISFSRGFGLTASQLGALLVPPGHPWATTYRRQWDWFTLFHNALAARAFLAIDTDALAEVDARRRAWTSRWLADRGLPDVESGSYYVRSFRPTGRVPDHLRPLVRDGLLRCCLKPTPT
jgi:hypothetical protein